MIEVSEIVQPLPTSCELISDNGVSQVWRGEGVVYKRSIPFLIENELWCLQRAEEVGIFVPHATRFDISTIMMEDLGESEPVLDCERFWQHSDKLIALLKRAGIRHGDLTTQAVIVKDNKPYIIDWAESRLADDPRPDKRPEGDIYWIDRTWSELCQKN